MENVKKLDEIENEIIGQLIKELVYCKSKEEANKRLDNIQSKIDQFKEIIKTSGIYL